MLACDKPSQCMVNRCRLQMGIGGRGRAKHLPPHGGQLLYVVGNVFREVEQVRECVFVDAEPGIGKSRAEKIQKIGAGDWSKKEPGAELPKRTRGIIRHVIQEASLRS